MKEWSSSWKSSKQPRKQRKYRYNAPLHIKHKFLSVHLSKELRKKYNKRAIPARKGDKIIIVMGEYKKRSGKIERVDLKNTKLFIEKLDFIKKDGNKAFYPIEPSNVIITELNLADKNRVKVLERGKKENKKPEVSK